MQVDMFKLKVLRRNIFHLPIEKQLEKIIIDHQETKSHLEIMV